MEFERFDSDERRKLHHTQVTFCSQNHTTQQTEKREVNYSHVNIYGYRGEKWLWKLPIDQGLNTIKITNIIIEERNISFYQNLGTHAIPY